LLILIIDYYRVKKDIPTEYLPTKSSKQTGKRYNKLLIGIGILAVLIVSFNFWFVNHAEEAIEELVYIQSNARLKLKVEKFKFNWLRNKIELNHASFYTTDTSSVKTKLSSPKIQIKARGILPLLFRNHLLIDSIHLQYPNFTVTKINPREKRSNIKDSANARFSVAKEMGKITNSINDAINVLNVNSFIIDQGSFSLIDNTRPADKPFLISKINIHLDNLRVDSTIARRSRKQMAFTDDIAVQSTNQNIVFPDGRHFLAFKDFRFNLKNKRVEFDSCTIRANKGDSSKTDFRIFFERLQMTNINFDTLYQAEVIQADSVFSANPKIVFNVDGDVKTGRKDKKKIQNIDDLVHQLLGDMMLKHVVVKDADIQVNTIKSGKTNSFEASRNNLEIQDLEVRQGMHRPVNVRRFMMALHNYENSLESGRYSFSFDSILFKDNFLRLNNFSFKEKSKGGILNSIKMPYFQLQGLSWESLLYDNIFNAQSAQFYDPDILFTAKNQKRESTTDLFKTLADIDDILNLNNLNIYNGKIQLNLKNRANFLLQHTNVDLYANELIASKKIKNIQHSIHHLSVDQAIFNKGNTKVTLNHLRPTEDNTGFMADNFLLNNENFSISAKDVRLNSIALDSLKHDISISGLMWNQGQIDIENAFDTKRKKTAPSLNLVLINIEGNNTLLNLRQGKMKASAFLNNISLSKLNRRGNNVPEIYGFNASGENFKMEDFAQRLNVSTFFLSDKNNVFNNVEYKKVNAADSIDVNIPKVELNTPLSNFLNKNFSINDLVFTNPVIDAKIGSKNNADKGVKSLGNSFFINQAVFQNPNIQMRVLDKNNHPIQVRLCSKNNNNFIRFENLKLSKNFMLEAKGAKIYPAELDYSGAGGKHFFFGNNVLKLEITDFSLFKNAENLPEWSTKVNLLSLKNISFDSVGKNHNQIHLYNGSINNIYLSSKNIKRPGDLITSNNNLEINNLSGRIAGNDYQTDWFNLNLKNENLTIDSLHFTPEQNLSDYKIKKSFDDDFFELKSGMITALGVDLSNFPNDSSIKIRDLKPENLRILTLKDKSQPKLQKKIKLLPTGLISGIPAKIEIENLQSENMYVEYQEIAETDKLERVFPVESMNLNVKNIKSFNSSITDSLYINASLRIFDVVPVHVHVKESYRDTLSGFWLKMNTMPVKLNDLNEALFPLTGVRVRSGYLDSLHFSFKGNNDYATGTTRMYYKNIKIQIFNQKDKGKQSLINKMVSGITNTFIIGKNIKGKAYPVFYERVKTKSFINFYVKAALSGILSGFGVSGAKEKQRKYLRNNPDMKLLQ
jgi:hypothetical protein